MISAIEIKNKDGFTLRGYLNKPDNADEVVVFLHGHGGSIEEHNLHFKKVSRMLEEKGIASLRMSYTGNGESDGTYLDYSIYRAYSDAKEMVNYVKGLGFKKIDLLGFSLGGFMSASICNYISFNKIVLWSPASPTSPAWSNIFSWYTPLEDGNYSFCGGALNKEFFLKDLDKLDPFKEAKKCNSPVLIIQGQADHSVSPDTARVYHDCFANSKLKEIDDCEHGYEKITEQFELYKDTVSFLIER